MAGKYFRNAAIIICVFVLSIIWAGSVRPSFVDAAATPASPAQTAVVEARGGLNVRSGPGTSHAVTAHVSSGAQLPVVDVSGDWVRVRQATGEEGWVAGWYVRIIENAATASASISTEPAPVRKTAVVTAGGGLNVRSGPGTSHAVVTHVSEGAQFPVVDVSGHWVRVELADGSNGWVAGWLVGVRSAAQPAPEAAPAAPENEESLPPGRTVIVEANGLEVKDGPNGAATVAYVTSGSKLPVAARSGAWYRVELPTGTPGWVPEAEVSVVREQQPSRGTAEEGGSDGRPGDSTPAGYGVKDRVIVLDPGHGGEDPGAIGPTGLREKDFNLAVALEAARLLRAEGADVVLTRSTDIRLGPTATADCEARSRIANESRADVFVSIHANANLNPASEGTSVYFHAHPENHADCVRLARDLQTSLVLELGRRDLGLFGSNLLVLRGIDMPGALIETAFISNLEEEVLLGRASFQQGAAKGITNGIKTYFGD